MEIKNKFPEFIINPAPQFRNTIAFLFFLIFWATLFIKTDTYPAGYRIGDDFEIVKLHTSVKSTGAYETIKKFVNEDLFVKSRFRPIWALNRSVAISVFDLNISLYMAYIGILAVFTSYFLYKFCITIGFSFIQSVFFSLVSLIGNASVIWIETSDAENIGMFFLSLTLYFLAKSVYDKRNSPVYKIGFYFFLICMCLSKESFILFIPAVLFLYLWLYSMDNEISVWQSIKKNIFTFSIIFLILIASLLMIKFIVLNNAPKYTGVDSKIFSIAVVKSFWELNTKLMISYLILVEIIILVSFRIAKKSLPENKSLFFTLRNDYINIGILFLLITVPQFVNYYKSTLLNRYYLPFILGFTFLMIYLYNKVIIEKYISKFFKLLLTVLVISFIYMQIKFITVPDYKQSSADSKMVSKFLGSITGKINKDSTMVMVIDPVQNIQPGRALLYYLRDLEGFNNVKVKFTKASELSPVYADSSFYSMMQKITAEMFKNESFDSLENKNEINGVAILWGLEENFLKENKDWFNPENFIREQFGIYRLYIRK